ncbi:MAG: hypothetical protein IJ306_02890, partial [Oscillospiraceae bacterium]|nr:hypothetical protein [Oscillospiraceae bacterium]
MIVDLFLKVLNLSIGALPLMAVLLVLRFIFKKAVPRKVFYIAWALVFLRLMVPFSIESDFSFFSHVPEVQVSEENIGTSIEFIKDEGETVEFPVFINPNTDNPNVDAPYHSVITGEIVTGPDITTAPTDKNLIFGTVWIFGTAALLLFGIIGYFAVLKKLKFESVAYTDKIRLSEFFKTPVVCGLVRPKIILPMNFDLDDEAKINSVISHECTHISRGDNFWRLLATFTLYVHWFNPLVWFCYNAFIRDMEVSCDEEVLAKAKNDIRSEYAESLVALAGSGTNPLYGGVLSFGECAIKERVKCIMNFKKTTLLIVILCIAAAVALGVIFLTNPSAPAEKEEISYSVIMEEGAEAKYSKENGLDVKTIITNTDDRTIWLGSATYIYHSADAETNGGTFAGICANDGVIMLRPGESAVFSDNISMDKLNGNYRFTLPDGYYTLQREVFLDEALTPTPYYAEFSFEIKYAESKALFSNDFSGKIVSGEVANKFIPSKDFSDEQVLADSNKALHYSNFLNNICSGTEGTGIKGITLIVQPSDKDYVVEMDEETANRLMSMIGKIEIKSTTKEVNPNTGGILEIYLETVNGSIVRIQYDGRLVVTGEAYENASVFDGEICREVFDDIQSLAEEILSGAEEYCEGETNPAIGYDLYAAIYSGNVPEGKYIPSTSVLPKEVVWADKEQKEYCENLLDSIDLGFASAFIVGNTGDESTRVGISKMEAFGLLSILQETELFVSEPTNPNTPAAKEIHVVMQSGDYIKIVWDTSYFTLYHKGDEVAYRFDGSRMKDSFTEFSNLANEYFIYGAGTQAQYPESSNRGDWTGTFYIIPFNTETTLTIFNNSDKTAINGSCGEILRQLLCYGNLSERLENTPEELAKLGEPLSGVDAVEFARTEDGKKYTFYLYENGFVLTGSAVPEDEKNQAWIVKTQPWVSFRETLEQDFSENDTKIPYWFGLINGKNVQYIYVQGGGGNGNNIMPEDDCFHEIIERLRRFGISENVERFSGNSLYAPDGEYIEMVITFNTGTVYNIIFTRDSVRMVSDDMNYGLNYKSSGDGYDEFLDFAMEGGLQN